MRGFYEYKRVLLITDPLKVYFLFYSVHESGGRREDSLWYSYRR